MKNLWYVLLSGALISCQPTATDNTVDVAAQHIADTELARKHLYDYTQLSDTYDFSLDVQESVKGTADTVFKKSFLTIRKKQDTAVWQELTVALNGSMYYDGDARSYTTGFNKDKEIGDGMHGDIVVADLNFDGREDVAVMTHLGYTAFYNFYIQDDKGYFVQNQWLSDNLAGFPETDKKQMTLTTYHRQTVASYGVFAARYNPATQSYTIIRREERDAHTDTLVK